MAQQKTAMQKLIDYMEESYHLTEETRYEFKKALEEEAEQIKTLVEQYRDEEIPNWNTPFHYDAEGWAAMQYFIKWLERKSKDR